MTDRAAQVRFYVDADIRGLGLILADLRNDLTYPADPAPSSISGSARHARSRARMYSTRTGYRSWPPGDG